MDIYADNGVFNMRHRPLIFVDIETTGLAVQKHEIIEIGALKVEPKKPFKIIEELSIKVKPTNLEVADRKSLATVNFTQSEWSKALRLEDALRQLYIFGLGGVMVGFNVNFDWAFLDRAYFQSGLSDPFYYHRLDVMSMAYMVLFRKKSLKRFSLKELSKYLKISNSVEHRALADIKITYLVFKKLFEYT